MARCVLLLAEGDATAAREALTLACTEHVAAGSSTELSVALVPSASATWVTAVEWLRQADVPSASTDQVLSQIELLLEEVTSSSSVELICHTSTNVLGAQDPFSPVSLGMFAAFQSCKDKGLRSSFTLALRAEHDMTATQESTDVLKARTSDWMALLKASSFCLPPSRSEAVAMLADEIDGTSQWKGHLHCFESTLSGVTMRPVQQPSGPTDLKLEAERGSRRELSGAIALVDSPRVPAAGSTLEMLRPVRASQIPAHLKLPCVWELRALPSADERCSSFLHSWAADCLEDHALLVYAVKEKSAEGSGTKRSAAVRRRSSRTSMEEPSPLILLIYTEGLRVHAQLCAPLDAFVSTPALVKLRETVERESTMDAIKAASVPPMLEKEKRLRVPRPATRGDVDPDALIGKGEGSSKPKMIGTSVSGKGESDAAKWNQQIATRKESMAQGLHISTDSNANKRKQRTMPLTASQPKNARLARGKLLAASAVSVSGETVDGALGREPPVDNVEPTKRNQYGSLLCTWNPELPFARDSLAPTSLRAGHHGVLTGSASAPIGGRTVAQAATSLFKGLFYGAAPSRLKVAAEWSSLAEPLQQLEYLAEQSRSSAEYSGLPADEIVQLEMLHALKDGLQMRYDRKLGSNAGTKLCTST